jgi:hypothetical protein
MLKQAWFFLRQKAESLEGMKSVSGSWDLVLHWLRPIASASSVNLISESSLSSISSQQMHYLIDSSPLPRCILLTLTLLLRWRSRALAAFNDTAAGFFVLGSVWYSGRGYCTEMHVHRINRNRGFMPGKNSLSASLRGRRNQVGVGVYHNIWEALSLNITHDPKVQGRCVVGGI